MQQLFYSRGRRIKGKKALLTSSLVDFYAIVAFVFIILIFYLIFAIGNRNIEQNIVSSTNSLNAEITLLNFLRSPVSIDLYGNGEKEQTTIAELILMIDFNDKESENFKILKERADYVLGIYWKNRQVGDVKGARIVLEHNKIKRVVAEKSIYSKVGYSEDTTYIAEVEIPSYYGKEDRYVVRLELYKMEFTGMSAL